MSQADNQNSVAFKFMPAIGRAINRFKSDPSIENLLEILFKLKLRGSDWKTETYCGCIHFLSVCTGKQRSIRILLTIWKTYDFNHSVLAVNPSQLSHAGYDKQLAATATACACAVSCVVTGLIGNLPFVSTPSLSSSIYLSAYLTEQQLHPSAGNAIVLVLGAVLIISSNRHVEKYIIGCTPIVLQRGICIGLSLLVSLQALNHLGLVVPGSSTILSLGKVWTAEVTNTCTLS